MRGTVTLTLVALLGLALTGCAMGPQGTWKMTEIVPPSAEGDFSFGTITFKANGNYVAHVSYGEKMKEMKGTYEYDDDTHLVTFHDTKGKTRTYKIQMCKCQGLMFVSEPAEPQWKATLKKQ